MVGGIFRVIDQQSAGDADYHNGEVIHWYYHLAWGTVSRAPRQTQRKRDHLPCVMFSIAYRRNQYVNYRVWADNPFAYDIALQLRMGDPVLVCSHGSEREYTPKRGKNAGHKRIERRGTAQFIIPMRIVAGVMAALKDATEAPDIIEGLEEYLRENAMEVPDRDYEIPF